ncbi:NEL-type E3 ubiquitin ligase domain-containing protein [Pseudomonas sp. B19125]|uniref:NEL-type E3 ubiquitin ligase domain-containing protein n=1 Tax=Pseudomonas sp. B19125 TaxID=3235109 RepID=UPI0037839512
MTEPEETLPLRPMDTLSAYIQEQQAQGPLMTGAEWSITRVLLPLRKTLERFFGGLDEQEQQDYIRLQKAYVSAQTTFEAAIKQLGADLETTLLASLTARLKALAGKEVDPKVARIHTRYVKPADTSTPNNPTLRVPRAIDDRVDSEGLSSVTLWEAACMNYSGLSGWGFPGHVSLKEASYLDSNVGISAADFIELVRELNLGTQLRTRLDSALQSSTLLGAQVLALATAELEFALIEALRTTDRSRVDREKYHAVVGAFSGESPWDVTQEVKLFIPYGPNNINGTERYGLFGVYTDLPRGDYLSIPYVIFSVKGCKGAFSYFPDRPGGALKHYDKFSEAANEFYVGFKAFHARKEMGWLYQSMSLSDYARLNARPAKESRPEELNAFAQFLYRLCGRASRLTQVNHIGYKRDSVYNAPTVSLYRFYIERCRANLKVLAHETPGAMATLLEFSQTLFGEIINLLLIPVPGPLKGLGRLRAFALFTSIGLTFLQALQEDSRANLVQLAIDIADLLSSRFLHRRLAPTVRRRHQALYSRLAQQSRLMTTTERKSQTGGQLVEKMMGATDVPTQTLERIVSLSNSSRADLDQVWDGAPPSASLVEAVNRFNVDKLIDWAAKGADANLPEAVGAVEILAPLLTQHKDWPKSTSLSIQNPQGVEVRRYSKRADHKTTAVVTVTVLESGLFAYSTPRRISAHLPQAIVDLLPDVFLSRRSTLVEQLADKADALRIDLFEALTVYADTSRSAATGAPASVLRLLPDSVASATPPHPVIEQLHTLHPGLSRARLLEVLRRNPLSEHQQAQLLQSQLQPEALYTALRSARQVARAETMVDGVLHPRRFSQKIQNWATEFAVQALRDLTGQVLVISPEAQAIPYVSRGPLDKTIVVIDHGRGQFSLFDIQSPKPRSTETDDLYQTVVSQISETDLLRLGWDEQGAASQFRHTVAQALLNNRTADGRFYPARREIGQYASVVETSNMVPEPDALGLYSPGNDRFVFIEGNYFKVIQGQGLVPWRIQHPLLEQAYAPVLTHNGAGAWRHEWENPLTWDGQKPFYRLGPSFRALTPDAIVQIQQISGVTPDILRRMHARNERPPAILRETVERFTIHQRLKTHLEGMETLEGTALGRDFLDELLGEIGPANADALVGRAGVSRADQVSVLEAKVMTNKPRMERLFFKALCHKSAQSSDPLAQVLQRDFPGLTAVIAQDLVSQSTPAERSSLEAGRVPLTLTPLVRWWLHSLRKARALEGVHMPITGDEDSAKLILRTLSDINGWPKNLRVEVWERGRLIDSIGATDSPHKRVLEVQDGQYQAYTVQINGGRQPIGGYGEFLVVLLNALPTAERQALGYTHVTGVEELTQEIARRLETQPALGDSRFNIEKLLGMEPRPWFNPPQRLSDGRIGYPLSGDGGSGGVAAAQVAQWRKLFPTKTDAEASERVLNLGESFAERQSAINQLFSEQEALNASLERWCLLGDSVNLSAHLQASERIRRCWSRQESVRGMPYELYLDDLALNDLPETTASFSHVDLLSLRNNQLQTLPTEFLRCFGFLRGLSVDGNLLDHLPQGLSELRYLQQLNLSNNRIRPNLQDVLGLKELTRLTWLDLSYNPLGQGSRLNLYRLKALEVLNLKNTHIHQLPRGAVTLRRLSTFDLRDNQLHVLTEMDLGLNLNVHRAMDLQGNELAASTLEVIRQYQQRPGYQNVHFGVSDAPLTVLSSVDPWLISIPAGETAQRRALWSLIDANRNSQSFRVLLGFFAAYPPFLAAKYRALREDISRRVWQLIDCATHDTHIERVLFEQPLEYIRAQADGWLLCLNDLELAVLPLQMLAPGSQAVAADFLNYYRGSNRIASIKQRATLDYPAHSGVEHSMFLLGCRLALAQDLNLPLPLTMRFSTPVVEIDPQVLNEYRLAIIRDEARINWPDLLKDKEYWVTFLELKYPLMFEAARSPYDERYQQALEQVQVGDLSENAYFIKGGEIAVAMLSAKNDLVLQLTAQEWAAFVGSD